MLKELQETAHRGPVQETVGDYSFSLQGITTVDSNRLLTLKELLLLATDEPIFRRVVLTRHWQSLTHWVLR